MFQPTEEQKAIIDAELKPQVVRACAGSGKTATAVRRLIEIRKRLGNSDKGYVVLLSFSNVAVNTFNRELQIVAKEILNLSDRILVSTVDSFIIKNIVLTHAAREMECFQQPFLIFGNENFLKNNLYNITYKKDNKRIPVSTSNIIMSLDSNNSPSYKIKIYQNGTSSSISIDRKEAKEKIEILGTIGAYTYDSARYWSIRTLFKNKKLAKILAKRYPFIIIDEAQDIGSTHAYIFNLLEKNGTIISRIGDENQAIFEFADADGGYIKNMINEMNSFSLTNNFRSISSIVNVANNIADISTVSQYQPEQSINGAYFTYYDKRNIGESIQNFEKILVLDSYDLSKVRVLCRGNDLIKNIFKGSSSKEGVGVINKLFKSCLYRDLYKNISKAFDSLIDGVFSLFEQVPPSLKKDITNNNSNKLELRKLLWLFLKDKVNGLPDSKLNAETEWLPILRNNINTLLDKIEELESSFIRKSKLGNLLKKNNLDNKPLLQNNMEKFKVKITTVHQEKGESLDAVLYITKKKDIEALLEGPISEDGRIGYVAITRPRELLIIGIPSNLKEDKELYTNLEEKGFIFFDDWNSLVVK